MIEVAIIVSVMPSVIDKILMFWLVKVASSQRISWTAVEQKPLNMAKGSDKEIVNESAEVGLMTGRETWSLLQYRFD